jgi:sec-independent protein translocase protein TatA
MGSLGAVEILVILGVALLLFGGSRLAGLGKGLGDGIRNFKRGIRDDDEPPPKPAAGKAKAGADDKEKPA